MSIAMVFPGQGSQSVGMQADLAAEYTVVQETYEEASAILGYDLWALVQDGPSERLAETVVTQPVMLTAGIAAYRVWLAAGGAAPQQVAGHSLGEYSALVAAESVGFADAMKVVIRRSELMQGAVPAGIGAMAAIIGLDDEGVIAACDEASSAGVVEAVNFNSPGQIVIAGHKEAVDQAIELCKAAGAKLAMLLPVSVPSHSSLMIGAGEALTEALAEADFCEPGIRTVAATDGVAYTDVDDIRSRLSRQVFGPVKWVDTISAMTAGGASRFIECGPGKVLSGLSRRIDRKMPASFIDSIESLQKSLDA